MRATPRGDAEVTVVCCKDGPLLIRGAEVVHDDQGFPHQVTRPVVAVCRCGKSSRQPWCDGTHKAMLRAKR